MGLRTTALIYSAWTDSFFYISLSYYTTISSLSLDEVHLAKPQRQQEYTTALQLGAKCKECRTVISFGCCCPCLCLSFPLHKSRNHQSIHSGSTVAELWKWGFTWRLWVCSQHLFQWLGGVCKICFQKVGLHEHMLDKRKTVEQSST